MCCVFAWLPTDLLITCIVYNVICSVLVNVSITINLMCTKFVISIIPYSIFIILASCYTLYNVIHTWSLNYIRSFLGSQALNSYSDLFQRLFSFNSEDYFFLE